MISVDQYNVTAKTTLIKMYLLNNKSSRPSTPHAAFPSNFDRINLSFSNNIFNGYKVG